MMRNFFKPNPPRPPIGLTSNNTSDMDNTCSVIDVEAEMNELELEWHVYMPAELVVYSSDEGDDADDESEPKDPTLSPNQLLTSRTCQLSQTPLLKRVRHKIPIRKEKQIQREKKAKEYKAALESIQKLLDSKRTKFAGGHNGLQAHQAWAIESFLLMMVKGDRNGIDASEHAAESHGFAPKWGGRNLRSWASVWMKKEELPMSKKGMHGKVYLLLNDPAIKAELRAFVRSNKWAMNPAKLQEFSQGKMIPHATDPYLRHLVNEEMPRGLKQYMELELFL
jgi:hypothetical protein